jgi:O-antigen/teichoic acid export membrane protein
MEDATHVADQILTASTALAGLLLVFLSNALAGFEGYDRTARRAVRAKYLIRGWLSFGAFTAALVSATLALLFYWDKSKETVIASAVLLLLSLLLGLIAAFIAARDIR